MEVKNVLQNYVGKLMFGLKICNLHNIRLKVSLIQRDITKLSTYISTKYKHGEQFYNFQDKNYNFITE